MLRKPTENHASIVQLHPIVDLQGVPWLASPHAGCLEQGDCGARLGVINLDVGLTYQVACDATDHTVYWGDLANVSHAQPYSGGVCSIGSSGTVSFDPGFETAFFLVVGNDSVDEGSYGLHSAGERPAQTVGICTYTQDLAGVICE